MVVGPTSSDSNMASNLEVSKRLSVEVNTVAASVSCYNVLKESGKRLKNYLIHLMVCLLHLDSLKRLEWYTPIVETSPCSTMQKRTF